MQTQTIQKTATETKKLEFIRKTYNMSHNEYAMEFDADLLLEELAHLDDLPPKTTTSATPNPGPAPEPTCSHDAEITNPKPAPRPCPTRAADITRPKNTARVYRERYGESTQRIHKIVAEELHEEEPMTTPERTIIRF